jgi:tetratricopeptide (TPR) repeat protein
MVFRSNPSAPLKKRSLAAHGGAAFAVLCALAACTVAGNGAPPAMAEEQTADEFDPTGLFGAYLAGRHAQHEKEYGKAARFYSRALSADPDDYDLMTRTLLLEASEGHIAEMVPLAQRVTAIEPNQAIGNLVQIVDKVKHGDFAGAEPLAAAMPKEGIHRFATPLALAWIKAGEKDAAAGVAALAALGETRGFAPLLDFHTALIHDVASENEAAEQNYLKLVKSQQRLNWRTADMLANLYERTGRRDEAASLIKRFLAETHDHDLAGPALARIEMGGPPPPRRVASAQEGLAEALFDLGSVMNQGETMDLGLIYARLALFLKPGFPGAAMLVADILDAQRRPAEALAINEKIDRNSPYGWSARARTVADLEALGRTDDAIAELRAMAAERPEKPQPLIQLGDLLRSKSRFAEAVEAYDAAASRLEADAPRLWNFHYSRGVALERSGDWTRAEVDLKKALELQPEQPLILNYLGYSWVDKGQNLTEALKMIERAVALRPNDGYIVDSLGWAHYRLGDYAKATEYLERAIELRPQDPTINDHLGDAYWRTGRLAEARSQWRRALQFGPEAHEVKAIETKIDKGLEKPAAVGSASTNGGG